MLTFTDEPDGFTGDFLDGEGGAASGVAVELCHDEAMEVEFFVELDGGIDGVAPDHGVANEEDVFGFCFFGDFREFAHEDVVDGESPCGIEDDEIAPDFTGMGDAFLANIDGVGVISGVDRDGDGFAEDLELFGGSGPIDVAGDEQGGCLVLFFEPEGEFCGGGGFTGALQSDEHDFGGCFSHGDGFFVDGPHEVFEFFLTNFDKMLSGCDLVHIAFGVFCGDANFLADGAFFDAVQESLDDVIIDVGFEQTCANGAQRLIDVGLVEFSDSAHALRDVAKSFGDRFKHNITLYNDWRVMRVGDEGLVWPSKMRAQY